MARRKDSLRTEKKILEAAGILFSRKGFRDATIAEICRMAGTNIASVNYHFGDKEKLYVESWRHAFRRSHEVHPPDGGVPPDAPPEERLRGWIVSFIERVADPASYDFEIMHMEMANPTGLLFDAMRESIQPIRGRLLGILRELLGDRATEEDVQLCEMSVQSQCMNPRVFEMRHSKPVGAPRFPRPPALNVAPEAIADHVIRFTLDGLLGVRRHIESRRRTGQRRRT